jgi:hypothetical protein
MKLVPTFFLLLVFYFEIRAQSLKAHGTFIFAYIGDTTLTVGADTRETLVHFDTINGQVKKVQKYSTTSYRKIGFVNGKGYALAGFRNKGSDSYITKELSKQKSLQEHVAFFRNDIKSTLEPSIKYQSRLHSEYWRKEWNNRPVFELMLLAFEQRKPKVYKIAFTLVYGNGVPHIVVGDSLYTAKYTIVPMGEDVPDSVYKKSLSNWRNESPPIFIKKTIINASSVIQSVSPPVDVLEISINSTKPKWFRYQK